MLFVRGQNSVCETVRHASINTLAGEHAKKRIDSGPITAATLCFGTTPPDPFGSRHSRRAAPRQGSRSLLRRGVGAKYLFSSPPAKLDLSFFRPRAQRGYPFVFHTGHSRAAATSQPGNIGHGWGLEPRPVLPDTPRSCRELHH